MNKVRNGRRLPAVVAAFALLGLSTATGMAWGDNVMNSVVENGIGIGGNVKLSEGGTVTVPYWIQENGSGGLKNCDATSSSPATVTINVPAGVAISKPDGTDLAGTNKNQLTFESCGSSSTNTQSVKFTPSGTGVTYVIPEVSVSDSSGDYNTAPTAFRIQVGEDGGGGGGGGSTNHNPVVNTAAVDADGIEGDTLEANGEFSDEDGDSLSLTADNTVGTFTDNGDGSWDWSLPTDDDVAGATITVTASDGNGGSATDDFHYSAANANPDIDEPMSFGGTNCSPTLGFSFSDPGSADTHTGSIDWGDGSTLVDLGSIVSPVSGQAHSYSSAGSYPLSVYVEDDDGGSDTATLENGYVVYNIPSSILQPINYTGPRSLFKLGSTIPVKITVRDCAGASVGTLSPQVSVYKLDGSPDGIVQETVSTASPTSGTTMRYDATGAQYIYNLGTKQLSSGDFKVKVTDPTFENPVEATFSLKK